jgi:hypothetical protein
LHRSFTTEVGDRGTGAPRGAENAFVRLAGRLIYVLHDLNALQVDPVAEGIDVIVSGYSHVPKMNTTDLLFASCSAVEGLAAHYLDSEASETLIFVAR